MANRSTETTLVFTRSFSLQALDAPLPAGHYRVVTEEEMIEGLSFPAWHRTATLLLLPALGPHWSVRQMVPVDPDELDAAQATNRGAGMPA
ncbi:hypothetical protein [Ferrovibrio sp.]|uniref:hypothetical protein n=1 Tax=Ferrovibrio sp. TaxID=1917215 RepID=UPI00311DFEB6